MKLSISLLSGLGCLAAVAASPVDSSSSASRFSFYDMKTPLAGPCDLCTGPDGAIWGEDILSNIIFRIDPSSGEVEEYNIPYTLDPLPYSSLPGNDTTRGAFACAIQPGADGNLYASSGIRNQLVKINPSTKEMTILTPPPPNPLGNLQPFNDLYTDSEGMYYTQTTGNVINYFSYATQNFTNYYPPTPESSPLGMFVAHDGLAYFAEFLGQKIGQLDRRTGAIREFPVPLPLGLTPAVIRVETEDRYIWFTCLLGNSVGRLDPRTGDVKLYPNNLPLSLVSEDTLSPDGRVWFSSMTQNTLSYVDPPTGKVVNIAVPGTLLLAPVSLPFQLQVAIHYHDGAIWFTQALGNRVGRYQL